ncbi:MAG: mismatch-specific DNA-glycosylase [Thermoleophilia bacterium]|nr:mismatch-specific DNA-glycosylase [Thermoleophilia bacterium]
MATPGSHPRPTRAQLLSAAGREIPDRVAPRVPLLLCGINPGLWSGWTGNHFAGPGNRLWPALEAAGVSDERLGADDGSALLALGVGITNMVARTTATAAEVTRDELRDGGVRLEGLLGRIAPGALAVLGMGAYRVAFDDPGAALGRQPHDRAGVPVWLLPNPSGLQARYGVDVIGRLLADAYAAGRARRPGWELSGPPPR